MNGSHTRIQGTRPEIAVPLEQPMEDGGEEDGERGARDHDDVVRHGKVWRRQHDQQRVGVQAVVAADGHDARREQVSLVGVRGELGPGEEHLLERQVEVRALAGLQHALHRQPAVAAAVLWGVEGPRGQALDAREGVEVEAQVVREHLEVGEGDRLRGGVAERVLDSPSLVPKPGGGPRHCHGGINRSIRIIKRSIRIIGITFEKRGRQDRLERCGRCPGGVGVLGEGERLGGQDELGGCCEGARGGGGVRAEQRGDRGGGGVEGAEVEDGAEGEAEVHGGEGEGEVVEEDVGEGGGVVVGGEEDAGVDEGGEARVAGAREEAEERGEVLGAEGLAGEGAVEEGEVESGAEGEVEVERGGGDVVGAEEAEGEGEEGGEEGGDGGELVAGLGGGEGGGEGEPELGAGRGEGDAGGRGAPEGEVPAAAGEREVEVLEGGGAGDVAPAVGAEVVEEGEVGGEVGGGEEEGDVDEGVLVAQGVPRERLVVGLGEIPDLLFKADGEGADAKKKYYSDEDQRLKFHLEK